MQKIPANACKEKDGKGEDEGQNDENLTERYSNTQREVPSTEADAS